MSEESVERTLGALLAKVESIGSQIGDIRADMQRSEEKASDSRSNVHRRLDVLSTRTAHLEATVTTMDASIGDMRQVTDGVKRMRDQAEGAGTLGHWLIKIGIAVLAAAGWLVTAYTYLTGKPPS